MLGLTQLSNVIGRGDGMTRLLKMDKLQRYYETPAGVVESLRWD